MFCCLSTCVMQLEWKIEWKFLIYTGDTCSPEIRFYFLWCSRCENAMCISTGRTLTRVCCVRPANGGNERLIYLMMCLKEHSVRPVCCCCCVDICVSSVSTETNTSRFHHRNAHRNWKLRRWWWFRIGCDGICFASIDVVKFPMTKSGNLRSSASLVSDWL